MNVSCRLRCLLLAVCLCGLDARADEALVLALDDVDAGELAALKQADGVDWWLELGDALLIGSRQPGLRLRYRATHQVLAHVEAVDPAELALHARGCGDTLTAAGETLRIWPLGSYDLVRRPRAFAPMPGGDPATRSGLAAPEWLPVEVDTVLARLHRFDRPQARSAEPGIAAIVDRVDGERWFADVETLAAWDRSSFAGQLSQARHWIAAEFAALGLAVSEPAFAFTLNGHHAQVANVVGRLEGRGTPDEWIVVGGHYDARNTNLYSPSPTPGADDNASGCAGVIEAARALRPFRPERSVLFLCYAGEEQGLRGSYHHVDTLSAEGELAKVTAMLNMDMIGWSADETLGVLFESRPGAANVELVELLADAAATYAGTALEAVLAYNSCCSDHMPYVNAGRPGVMSIHRGRAATYPHYHRDTDTAVNLGPHARAIGTAIVRSNVAALALLSGASDVILIADNELP